VLWFGSGSFLTAVVRDPLAVDMPFLRQRSEPVGQHGAASVDGVFARVRLSRDARYFLLSEYDADEYPEADGATQRHVVGTFDGWSRPIDAADVAFVDDTTLFVADRSAGGLRLRTEDVRGGRMRWSLTLDERLPVTLETGPGGRWRIVRRHVKAFATTAGRVGSQSVERTGWSPSTNPEEYVTHFLHDGDARALAVTGDWQAPRLRWLAAGWRSRTSFLGLGAEGASRLATSDLSVSCAQPPIGGRGPVCAAFDGRLTRFWKYDGDARRFEPLGQLRGFVWPLLHDSNGVFAAGVGGRPALLDFDRGEVVAFEGSRGGLDLASAAGYVVSVRGDGSRTEVTLYHAAARPVSTP
jgi:hypothetical protein